MPAYKRGQQAIFTTVRSEGAILPVDLLQRVAQGDTTLGGLTPDAYHLSGEKLNEAINRCDLPRFLSSLLTHKLSSRWLVSWLESNRTV